MKKSLFFCIIFFSLLGKNAAQEGIFAIARYDSAAPPKFRYDDPLTEFSGGFEAFKNIFSNYFKTPVKALRGNKAPDGMIGFTVNLVGKIVAIEVIDTVSAEIDAEAVRVLADISEFHPQPKPLKFAILYNAYPDWFLQYVQEKEQAEKYRLEAMKADSVLKNTKITDLAKLVDNRKVYASGDIWVGLTTMNDPLSKFLKPTGVFGVDLNLFKRKGFLGGNLQIRSTRLKQDFDYKDAYWAKDTSISLFSMGFSAGIKVIDEERLAFTPFVSLGFGILSLPSDENYTPPDGSSIASFAPTFGFFVDYKYRVRARRVWIDTKLNTSSLRLRLGVSPMNFKNGRHGNVVDLGIGLAFSQQTLKLD